MSEVQPIVESNADPIPVDQNPVPKPKRSPVERALVWGGILLLLVVVGSELIAQRSFSTTLTHLEETFDNGVALTEVELPSHITGYVVRDEEDVEGVRVLTVRWPSLFRTYKIRMPIALGDVICVVETERGHFDQLAEMPTSPIESRSSTVADGN